MSSCLLNKMATSSSKAALSKQLKSQLICPVCLDQYTDLRVLPCAHCFCKDCIDHFPVELENERYVVRCPTCRQPSEMREIGAAGLPVDFHINNLLEIDQRLNCFKCSAESHRDHQCDYGEDLFMKHKQQIEACLEPVKKQIY